MPGIDFREAKARLRIAEVLDLIGFQPQRLQGAQVRGPCPLHRSRSATSRVFAVHLTRNVYHCFACGASGNALDLWAAWTRQGLHPAVIDLYQRLGRDIPWLSCQRSPTATSAAVTRTKQEDKSMPDP
jgi:DNA primase